MKKLFISLFCLSSSLSLAHEEGAFSPSEFYSGGKNAIIMAHFGTTHNDTREKTINAINKKANNAFNKKADVFEVYTSRIVAKRVREKEGITKLNTTELLNKLHKEGYTNVIIQPTNIIDGVEMDAIKQEVSNFSKDFKDIRVGNALLTTPEQYEKVLNIISKTVGNIDKNQAIVLVGHGSYDPGNSAYCMLDYMAKDMNLPIYVGTIEGYPTMDTMVKQLKKDNKSEIILMPLMFVAGDHAKNDIAGDWKKELEKKGFKVTPKILPLGEIEDIQNMYIENIKYLEHNKPIDILVKKDGYSK